jgi:hypothetical protein
MGIFVLYQQGVLYKKAEDNKYYTDCDILPDSYLLLKARR